jgi:hypothetical protein
MGQYNEKKTDEDEQAQIEEASQSRPDEEHCKTKCMKGLESWR